MIEKLLGIGKGVMKCCSKHSTVICMVGATAGVIGTSALAFKAGVKTGRAIGDIEWEEETELTFKEKAKVAWGEAKGTIISAGAVGGLTIGMIIASGIIDIKRQKALSTGMLFYKEALDTYKESAKEVVGEKKEGEIRSKVAEKVARDDKPDEEIIFSTGEGDTLFKDRISGRYFRADAEWLRQRQNEANMWFLAGEDFISINEWYSLIGLEQLPDLEDMGWNVEETINFELNAGIGPNSEPYILIDYDISPRYDWGRYH